MTPKSMKDKYISFSSLNLTVFRKRKWRTGQKEADYI
jgi:hypothetical protein